MKKFAFLNFMILATVFISADLLHAVGSDDFREIIAESKFFVDKTLLIKDVIDSEDKVILITRPRRWGKSLNLSMLKYFFKAEVDIHGKLLETNPNLSLFKGGEVDVGVEGSKLLPPSRLAKDSQWTTKYRKYQGRYPVMSITLKDIRGSTFSEMKSAFESQIIELYEQYKYLPPISDWWKDSGQRKDFFLKKIREEVLSNENIGVSRALVNLSKWLYEHHGARAYFFLDEYDTPLNESYEHGYPKEAVELIRDLLSSMLKGNAYLEKAVLTGILRISKVNLFSGMNNFEEYSVLSKQFAEHYGFTEKEVDMLLEESGFQNKTDSKSWYNGYSIGNETIYNPWSIVHYLKYRELKPYWLESGTTDLIKHAMASEGIQDDLATLRAGKSIKKSFQKDIPFFNFSEDETALWALLLYAGYLTSTECQLDVNSLAYLCELRIPNLEISGAYGRFLQDLLVGKKMPKLEQLGDVGKVFEAISERNAAQVRKLLAHKKLTPFSEEWNFNFLQLAVLAQDKDTFNVVYEYYNDAASIGMKSREGLSIVDFTALARVNYEELKGINRNLESPAFLEKACWFNPLAVGGVAGLLNFAYTQMPNKRIPKNRQTNWHQIKKTFGIVLDPGLGVALGGLANYLRPMYCDSYHKFHAIDVSQPRLLSSWNQFAKYAIQNPGSYLSLGSHCKNNEELVANFKQSPFSIQLPGVKIFDFVLCNKPSTSTEL